MNFYDLINFCVATALTKNTQKSNDFKKKPDQTMSGQLLCLL